MGNVEYESGQEGNLYLCGGVDVGGQFVLGGRMMEGLGWGASEGLVGGAVGELYFASIVHLFSSLYCWCSVPHYISQILK